jgi:fumarylacetoacetase
LRSPDETHARDRKSWVQTANRDGCEFPIQNLPFGIFSRNGGPARFGIAIGDFILDVAAAADAGFISGPALAATDLAGSPSLNSILALDPRVLTALRRQVADLLDESGPNKQRVLANRQSLLVEQSRCELHLPAQIGDYTDFFAGIHHARTTGAAFRPDNPLPLNYKWIPLAYHARASSVVVSGTPVHRPFGQMGSRGGKPPRYAPSGRLDFELELGFYIGHGNSIGSTISIANAADHIAGYCLLNDWSARDIQRWESAPLGPFLGKSFVTTVSTWVVTSDALLPFRCPVMTRDSDDPSPLPYLLDNLDQETGGLDIELSALLQTQQMRRDNIPAVPLTSSNAKHLYWTPAQMVAHHASGGCNLRSGDLIGSGTISGPAESQRGSLLELTGGGKKTIELPNGEVRGFLEDGDEITFSATCRRDGFVSIGFGTCVGRIVPAATRALSD